MTRFLMSVALAATALTSVPAANGAERRGESRGEHRDRHSGSYSNYHTRFGTKFSHGYYYSGRDHHHWTYRYFWSQYGCDCYWCPSTSCWYYWCEPRNAYLPVSVINEAPPTPVAAAAAAASSSANVAPTVVTNVIGATPQGPVALPSDLPPPVPPSAPTRVTNSSVGSVGTVQPIGPSVPLPPGR